MTDIDRRTALLGMGAIAASVPALSALGMTRQDLGYNAETGEYTLPPLPYAYDALEPFIDTETMKIHHDKHHAGYVKGLNNAVAQLSAIRAKDADIGLIKHWERELAFHGSGHVNHVLFWTGMGPDTPKAPTGPLAEAISRDFGSFDAFTTQYTAAATKVEGSGWGWLAYEPLAGRLIVLQGEKHQNLTMTGSVPLLGVDVWEHAYYLKYQNRRADYVQSFMKIVNWPEIERRFAAASGG